MFDSHFSAGLSFAVVLDRFLFISGDKKKVIAGRVRQVVVLYSNNCMGICLGGLSISRCREAVVF